MYFKAYILRGFGDKLQKTSNIYTGTQFSNLKYNQFTELDITALLMTVLSIERKER